MAYPIDEKLVIAVATSALFDLRESDEIFQTQGEKAYRAHQREQEDVPFSPGTAFPFVRRVLALNDVPSLEQPVEVVLLSHNDGDTGLRAFNSVRHHNLSITRGSFCGGLDPFRYMKPYNAVLYLSHDERAVAKAMADGRPAGRVLPAPDDAAEGPPGLRVAFDFDAVLASDEAEAVYQRSGLPAYHDNEREQRNVPLQAGPLQPLLTQLGKIQAAEWAAKDADPNYERQVKIAIFTARNAPAESRMIRTLREWGVQADETHFLGGIQKDGFLEVFHPHIFFDDQMTHLDRASSKVPSVHVPFGIVNAPKPSRDEP